MCKYCNIRDANSDYVFDSAIELAGGGYTELYIGNELDGRYILLACGDDEAHVEINFCPMCGRKLNA